MSVHTSKEALCLAQYTGKGAGRRVRQFREASRPWKDARKLPEGTDHRRDRMGLKRDPVTDGCRAVG